MQYPLGFVMALLANHLLSNAQMMPPGTSRGNQMTRFMTAGGVTYRLCGESLRMANPAMSRMNYPNPAPQANQQQGRYNPMMRPGPAQPGPHRSVYSIDLRPQYRPRMKRQVGPMASGGYQHAFVPDTSHLQNQRFPQQSGPQHGMGRMPQHHGFMGPQHGRVPHHLQGLLHALDPPDPPDLPDHPMRPPLARNPAMGMRPGQAIRPPQRGPPISRPTAQQANQQPRRGFRQPPPQPPPQPPQPPPQPPAPPQQQMQAAPAVPPPPPPQQQQQQPYAPSGLPAIPVIPGMDTICFCTDTKSCLWLEGNMELMYMSTCPATPAPNGPQVRGDVCCCIG